jgi:hypothetical protein
VLEFWMQVRSTGYALMHLLALHLPETFPLATIAPWRKRQPVITSGLFAGWMRQHFFGVAFRQDYDRKSQKFTFPAPRLGHLFSPPLPESVGAARAHASESPSSRHFHFAHRRAGTAIV